MTLKKAKVVLYNHQQWRIGNHVEPKYKHEELTPAIDKILSHLKL